MTLRRQNTFPAVNVERPRSKPKTANVLTPSASSALKRFFDDTTRSTTAESAYIEEIKKTPAADSTSSSLITRANNKAANRSRLRRLIAVGTRFCAVSPIHGCSYIDHAEHMLESVIWLLLLLACFGCCLHDTITLVTLYLSMPTSISVRVLRNDTLLFPQAGFCFDVFRPILIPSLSKNFNESSLNQTLEKLTMTTANTGRQQLSQLPTEDPQWDMLMKTTYVLLMSIIDYDFEVPGLNATLDQVTSRAVELVDSFYQRMNYGYADLLVQTARYLCRQALDPAVGGCTMQYVLDQSNYICFDFCKNASLNWFGQTASKLDDVCFSLYSPPSLTLFRTSSDYLATGIFYISRASLLVGDWATHYGTTSFGTYGVPNIYLDLRGYEGLVDFRYFDSVMAINDNTSVWAGAELLANYVAYNKSTNPCGSEAEISCALRCLMKRRRAQDGCTPLGSYLWKKNSMLTSDAVARHKTTRMPICNRRFTTAEAANVSARPVPDYTGRFKACLYAQCPLAPCNMQSYQYQQSTSATSYGIWFAIESTRFVYPVMTEYLTMDISAFLADFGGILGLWIGGSLISLVHIPVFSALTATHRWFKPRGEVGTSSPSSLEWSAHSTEQINGEANAAAKKRQLDSDWMEPDLFI